jgi:hypothetical protein
LPVAGIPEPIDGCILACNLVARRLSARPSFTPRWRQAVFHALASRPVAQITGSIHIQDGLTQCVAAVLSSRPRQIARAETEFISAIGRCNQTRLARRDISLAVKLSVRPTFRMRSMMMVVSV